MSKATVPRQFTGDVQERERLLAHTHAEPGLLHTVRGIGYVLRVPQT